LADHLAEAGHDATHVVRIGLAGAPDPQVLARAASEDRILVTTDTDFPTLLALSGEPIPSVLLLRRISDSIPGRLAAILSALPSIEEELEAGAVAVVERDRVRLRSLPIEPT
jgi:predicted nuclease of predicted toxin-antitoxin system